MPSTVSLGSFVWFVYTVCTVQWAFCRQTYVLLQWTLHVAFNYTHVYVRICVSGMHVHLVLLTYATNWQYKSCANMYCRQNTLLIEHTWEYHDAGSFTMMWKKLYSNELFSLWTVLSGYFYENKIHCFGLKILIFISTCFILYICFW